MGWKYNPFLKKLDYFNTAAGSGDMSAAAYDPTAVEGDAFDSANHAYDNSVSGLTASTVQGAIDEISATTIRVELFEEISGTSGTITAPTGATIAMDQYANGVDAIVTTITTTGEKPNEELARTAAGAVVTCALSGVGNLDYSLSGTPTGTQWAVQFVVNISLADFQAIDLDNVIIAHILDSQDVGYETGEFAENSGGHVTATHLLTLTHSLGSRWVHCDIYDASGVTIFPDKVTRDVDGVTVVVDLTGEGALTGTWTYKVSL